LSGGMTTSDSPGANRGSSTKRHDINRRVHRRPNRPRRQLHGCRADPLGRLRCPRKSPVGCVSGAATHPVVSSALQSQDSAGPNNASVLETDRRLSRGRARVAKPRLLASKVWPRTRAHSTGKRRHLLTHTSVGVGPWPPNWSVLPPPLFFFWVLRLTARGSGTEFAQQVTSRTLQYLAAEAARVACDSQLVPALVFREE
jgi:hypothetical protein